MSPLRHSVRFRLTLWYAGVLALVLVLFSASVYVFVVRTLETSINQAVQTNASPKQTTRDPKYSHHDPHESQNSALLTIYNIPQQAATGKRSRTPPETYGEYPIPMQPQTGGPKCVTRSLVAPDTARPAPKGRGTVKARAPAVPAFRYKICYPNGNRSKVVDVVIESLTGVDKTLERLRVALLLVLPFTLLLAGVGGWILAGRALEPVNHITRMARSITATDLSRRINLGRRDELGRLAGTFDEMIDRLERAFQEQRQLTADVSHELRSPLTILEAQTTLALRRSRGADEYRQVLGSVQEEVERMAAMVNELLTLARADAGEEEVHLGPVQLRAVAEPVVEAMQPLAAEKKVSLVLKAGPGTWALGDAGRLRQLLLNLLDNALSHTPSAGQIAVVIQGDGERATIRVQDTGEGIAEKDLPHIFQRFYRGDQARQRGTGNSGLGLAIVKWIAEAHGGSVEVTSSPGAGSTFIVSLTAVAPPIHTAVAAVV